MNNITLERSIHTEKSDPAVAPIIRASRGSMKISTVICLVGWTAFGSYYYGFKNGQAYGLSQGQKQLTEAHMIITNGMIANTEGSMAMNTTTRTATSKRKKGSKTMPASIKKPAITVTDMGKEGYLVRPTIKGGGTIQSMTLTMRFKGKS
jgi:hypothetical protein